MQKVTVGDQELVLIASPITPWVYKKAFGEDMLSELASMSRAKLPNGEVDPGAIGFLALIQMLWAMAKTADPRGLPDFPDWLASLPELDIAAIDFEAVMNELQRGFFRSGKGDAAIKEAEDAE